MLVQIYIVASSEATPTELAETVDKFGDLEYAKIVAADYRNHIDSTAVVHVASARLNVAGSHILKEA